jgi:hypothetical protein
MKYQHDRMENKNKERPRTGKEKVLTDLFRRNGFYLAAANIDFRREHIDIDTAIASWRNFPQCLDEYPTVITKKVKLDPKDLI